MNYYERHLGDYAKDTAHLSMIEHGAYSLLLDRYYGSEQGIPDDQVHRITRARSKEEKQAVDIVLAEFFTKIDGVWINRRAKEEIEKTQLKINAAKENGKKGGRPKKQKSGYENETQQKPTGLFLGYENETKAKAHQSPVTSHHLNPLIQSSVLIDPVVGVGTETNAMPPTSRAGEICKQLRKVGIDAAPHQPQLLEMLGTYSDEAILAIADIAVKRKPGERISVGYLAPMLSDAGKPRPSRTPIPENFESRDYGSGVQSL